jgi:hypothetical protein
MTKKKDPKIHKDATEEISLDDLDFDLLREA